MPLITSVTQRFSPTSEAQINLTSEPPEAVSLLQSGFSIPTPERCFWECRVSMVTVLNSLSAAGEHSVRDDGKLQCSFNGNIKPAQDAVKLSKVSSPFSFRSPLHSYTEAGTRPLPRSSSDCPVLHGKSYYLFVRAETKQMSLKGNKQLQRRTMLAQAASSFPHSSLYGAGDRQTSLGPCQGRSQRRVSVVCPLLERKQGLKRLPFPAGLPLVPDAGTVKSTAPTQALQQEKLLKQVICGGGQQNRLRASRTSPCLTAENLNQSNMFLFPFTPLLTLSHLFSL